jgi:sulfoxide reductase heme-binding subunit YedZ
MSSVQSWRRVAKPLVFLLALTPLGLLIADALGNGLGANPVEAITHRTGDWALRFLLLTLAVTPLRRLTRCREALRFRRMLGLFAFFYAIVHLLTWVWLDQWFRWEAMLEDVIERPYVTAGMVAFALMVPLAVTSTRGMMRRLGRRWQALHRLVYAVGALGCLHFLWLTKADFLEPGIYAAILVLLLVLRVPVPAWGSRDAPAASAAGPEGGSSRR